MVLRTSGSVWWPNISEDLAQKRESCQTCRHNAPTQLPTPPRPPSTPQYPFQLISSDYFVINGHTYLVIVDRYSNWPVIRKCKTESASELISSLREFFTTYGVPEQLASDGGSNYTAEQTRIFLETWGVKHRISSAYKPQSGVRGKNCQKADN